MSPCPIKTGARLFVLFGIYNTSTGFLDFKKSKAHLGVFRCIEHTGHCSPACHTVCHKLTIPHPHSPTFLIVSSHDIKSKDLMTHSDALTDYVVKHDPCQGSTDPLITLQNIFHPFWSSSCLAWSRLGYHHLSSHKPISFYLS